MIPKECKRLAEVDFPIAVVSRHAAREKEARSGHIPKIHIWPAARPTASSRAMLLALLIPDPCDPRCPEALKTSARTLLPGVQGSPGPTDEDLRRALLKFVGDFANWDLAAHPRYLEVGRGLVRAAYPEEPPLVVDPFAGGGSIPLEALRLGCEAFASDLNPVACLILKVLLEDIPRHGPTLAEELRRVGGELKEAAERELTEFYPPDPDGARPITYLWARTVRCETPRCGAEIPLVRSFWLCKKADRRRALRYRVVRPKGEPPQVEFEVFVPKTDREVPPGTVRRAKATCLACHIVLAPERVRAQLQEQRGGADVIFDKRDRRVGGAKLLAVVTLRPGEQGRHYRPPTGQDNKAVLKATRRLEDVVAQPLPGRLSVVPDESLPPPGTLGFRVQRYGMLHWGDIYTARQKLALVTFSRLISASNHSTSVRSFLGLNFSKMIDMNNALSTWQPHAEIPAHMMTRFAVPMKWDFSEAVPISDSSGTMESAVKRSTEPLGMLSVVGTGANLQVADALEHPLPDQTAPVWFTDPPYYDAVPYADLSDFFFVWLKRALPEHPLLRDPFNSDNPLTPKAREVVQNDRSLSEDGRPKDRTFYEEAMASAFAEGRRVLREDGIGAVVFAHKTTEGWEALLSGLIRGGWTITGSWPIATEMGSRLRARDSAALATSIHLVCRPRSEDAPTGDWAEVLRELPGRVGEWMDRLQKEGVRGADLVFACIGPALEIFSRYSKVVDPEERGIPLGGNPEASAPHERGYLTYVWEVVGRTALAQILGAGDDGAAALEEDARLTALFLWTLQSTNGAASAEDAKEEAEDEQEVADADDEDEVPRRTPKGYTLIFDVARRFAQPLGIHLPDWEGRIIETHKGVVRLLPIAERALRLFGKDGAEAVAERLESTRTVSPQQWLFPELDPAIPAKPRGRRGARIEVSDESLSARREATTLDRVHAAMLLQASGRANALRALLGAEQERGPEFLRLANALSALYPRESEEKRLLDAMLLAVRR